MAFFLNSNIMVQFLQKQAVIYTKANFCAKFSGENHNIGPGLTDTKCNRKKGSKS
jgi:hypothetical protein